MPNLLTTAFVRFRSLVQVSAVLYAGFVFLLCFPYFQGQYVAVPLKCSLLTTVQPPLP